MKKLLYLADIFNLFFGILLYVNTYIIYEVNLNILLSFIGIIIFEVSMLISYLNRFKVISFIDYFINAVYFIFIISYLFFILIYQNNNMEVLSLVYYSKFLFIPHFLYAIIANGSNVTK